MSDRFIIKVCYRPDSAEAGKNGTEFEILESNTTSYLPGTWLHKREVAALCNRAMYKVRIVK